MSNCRQGDPGRQAEARASRRFQTYSSAQEIALALHGHRTSSGWLARCPAHKDVNPSLSIVDGRNGRPVVYCHAACDWRDVFDKLAAMGLMPRFERGRP
jgi:hypothetical protein